MTHTLGEMKDLAERASGVTDILNDINSHVDNVNSQIGQIATAAQQQTTATSEISNNMQGVSTLTQQSANSSQDSNDENRTAKSSCKGCSVEKLAVFKLERNLSEKIRSISRQCLPDFTSGEACLQTAD